MQGKTAIIQKQVSYPMLKVMKYPHSLAIKLYIFGQTKESSLTSVKIPSKILSQEQFVTKIICIMKMFINYCLRYLTRKPSKR